MKVTTPTSRLKRTGTVIATCKGTSVGSCRSAFQDEKYKGQRVFNRCWNAEKFPIGRCSVCGREA